MSSEAIVHLGRNEMIESLESQRGALRSGSAERLVIDCNAKAVDPMRWRDLAVDALCLHAPAGERADDDVRGAIQHAIAEAGVEEVVLVARAGHPREPKRLEAVPSGGGSTFMERVQQGARRHRRDVDEAKDRIRKDVSRVESQVGPEVRVVGIVEVGEGGAMIGYVPKDDAFVPIA